MKKVLITVVVVLVVLAAAVYLVFFRPQVPLELRYPPTSRPTDCFAGAEGTGESAEATAMTQIEGEPVDLPFDLSGTWALREVSSTLSRVPIIGDLETTTTSILQVEIRQNQNRLSMVTQTCSLEAVNDSDTSRLLFPPAFMAAMVASERQAIVEPTESGYRFRQVRHSRLLGANLDDPVNDPLPTDKRDPRVTDNDGDGHPGVTVRIEGLVDGDVYLVQRNWNELCGDVTSPDRVEGYLWWGSRQSILDASNFLLKRSAESIPNPDWERNRFLMCRVQPGLSCEEIVSDPAALFAACSQP
ncbi:MAG: hypothetical protein JW797_08930 [Bradymonadales bacterium]|nr:hypothetical protein [Bradymonadales bacterium]